MIPNWLSLVDVVFLVVVFLFAWGGSQKGFAEQVSHIITFLALGLLLFFAYPAIFSYLGRVFRGMEPTYLMWLLLAGVVGLCILVFSLASKLLAGMMKTQISDTADMAWGFVLGLLRGTLVALFAMVFLVMLDASGRIYDKFRMKSHAGQLVCYEMVPRIQPHLSRAVLEEKANVLRDKLLEQEEAGVIE